jgi:ABC-type bacteriocin/lantibiotic exporter with double-glycine peptidase domain
MPNDWLPVPHYRQSADGQCLPACVRMVLAYLERELSEAQVAKLLRSQSFGTPAPNVRYLESLGFSVTYGPISLARLRAYVQNGKPCIVFVQAGDLLHSGSEGFHAVVVVGVGEHSVYVNDPASDVAPQSVPLDHLMLAWSEFEYACAVITRPQ